MSSKQEDRRKRIYNFYLENRSHGKEFTVNHFKAENVPKTTIYRIIQSAENDSGHQRIVGSGRKAQIMTKKRIGHLKKTFKGRDGVTIRQAARKFDCSKSHIHKTLSEKTTIVCRKKINIPDRSEAQKIRIKTCVDRLYRKLGGVSCVMDDESYFTLSHSTINGNQFFYSSDVKATPANTKYRTKKKFEKKLLVWLCFSEKGMAEPYFIPSGLAVNQKIYLEECIKSRLIPFIKEHHSDGNYVFWPDLASSHYAKTVTKYLDENKVKYVFKEDNPPNLPECRPIEDLWSILKGKVYANNWKAETLDQLQLRIVKCLDELDKDLVNRLFRDTRLRLGRVRSNGLPEDK